MKNWKGTTGEAISHGLHVSVDGKRVGQSYIMEFKHDKRGKGIPCFQGENNAKLFADALNTVNKCDLHPSELLKQRDELLAVANLLLNDLQCVTDFLKKKHPQILQQQLEYDYQCQFEAINLIKQIEG